MNEMDKYLNGKPDQKPIRHDKSIAEMAAAKYPHVSALNNVGAAADSANLNYRSEDLPATPASDAAYASIMPATRAADGNHIPKGFENTPFDDRDVQVQRGEAQRKGDPLTAAGLIGDLAKSMDAVLKAVKARGGLKGIRASVKRAQDASTRRTARDSARNAAKASDSAWLEAARAQDAGMKAAQSFYPSYFDKSLGLYRPVRPE